MNIERKISRREFLIGAISAAVLAGCKKLESFTPTIEQTEPPLPTETLRPTDAPTPKPTDTSRPTAVPTPEATPTPEPRRISAITITQEYLKSAFAGIGGGEIVEGGKEEMSMTEFGQKYVSDAWGEKIDIKNLPEDPIASLKYLVSLGSYRGEEGIFSPGKQGEELIFPQLADLSLARLTLEKVPTEAEQISQEYQKWVTPLNFLLRSGTQMTVVGEFKTREEAEINYVLVAFTDYLRASEEGIPRHYLAIIPDHFPKDPENKNALSLKNLLEANGYRYDPQAKTITVVDELSGQESLLELNQISGEELIEEIRQATGIAFVDQMKGELIANPVVPYPEEMPAVWETEEVKDENDNISLILRGQDGEGKFQDFAKARYDFGKGEWVWKKIEQPPEKPEWLPAVSNTEVKFNNENKRWEFYTQAGAYLVSVRENNGSYEFFEFADEVYPHQHPELFAGSSWEEIRARMEETGAVKVLPCGMENVRKLDVWRKDGIPYSLDVYLNAETIFYYPFDIQAQANPAIDLRAILLDDINPDIRQGIKLWVDEGFVENYLGRSGKIANLGLKLAKCPPTLVAFIGREFENEYNRMTLDSFVRDAQGRLMHPGE